MSGAMDVSPYLERPIRSETEARVAILEKALRELCCAIPAELMTAKRCEIPAAKIHHFKRKAEASLKVLAGVQR